MGACEVDMEQDSFAPGDLIVINPTEEELEGIWDQVLAKKAAREVRKGHLISLEWHSTLAECHGASQLSTNFGHRPFNDHAVQCSVHFMPAWCLMCICPGPQAAKKEKKSKKKDKADKDKDKGEKRKAPVNGCDRVAAKRSYKAGDHVPEGASKEVWSSLFTSSSGPVKETFACRATSARGMNLQ